MCQTGAGVRGNNTSFTRKILTCFRIGSLQEHCFLFYVLGEMNEAVYLAVRYMWRMLHLRFKRSS